MSRINTELKELEVKVAGRKRGQYDPRTSGITVSLLQKWLRCRYSASLYLSGWSPLRVKDSMNFGNLFHGLLHHVYDNLRTSGSLPRKPAHLPAAGSEIAAVFLDRYYKEAVRTLQGADLETMQRDLLVCLTLIKPYLWFWRGDFYKRRWIGLETQFDINFRGFRLRGKRDGVYETKSGDVRLLETKTKSRLDNEEELTDALVIDLQCMFYLLATRLELGQFIPGVTYNIVRRPGLYVTKGESAEAYAEKVAEDIEKRPLHYFVRYELDFAKVDQRTFRDSLAGRLREFEGWCRGEVANYRNETSCLGRFNCSYLNHCASGSFDQYCVSELFKELEDI